MIRWLAGTFDPSGRFHCARPAGSLMHDGASTFAQGPLRVACSGEPSDSTGPLCLLDGYIDNAGELAAALGVPLPSSLERLLASCWQRWDHDLLPRLRGDFALLIWDRERGEGLLARDQLGARSLFVYHAGGALCFANEIRHLLGLLPRRPSPDPVGLAHWVACRGRPGPGTLYAGVRRLEPGGALRLGLDGVREFQYWKPRFREPAEEPDDEVALQVREAISVAVERRLSPTGSTGVLMSGGLDSSAVAACASAREPASVRAYCGVFPEHPAVDESGLISQLTDSLRLPGITAEVRAGGLLQSALESQHEWDAPLVGWGDFWSLPLLREAAADGAELVLGGDGGDELFGARSYLLADRLRSGRPLSALGLVRRLPGAAYGPPVAEIARVTTNLAVVGALPYGVHRLLSRPFAARTYPAWLRPQALRDLLEYEDPLAWKRLDGPRWWASAVHALTRGLEELGVFESLRRTAMLAGLDARHPLLDLDLIELVLAQPPACSFDARMDRPLLRASMAGLLPDAVRLRPRKALFDSLITDSLLGSDRVAVHALLRSPDAELGGIVDLDAAAQSMLDGGPRDPHYSFRATQYLWRMVTAECWLRAQADHDVEVIPAGVTVSAADVSFRPRDRACPAPSASV